MLGVSGRPEFYKDDQKSFPVGAKAHNVVCSRLSVCGERTKIDVNKKDDNGGWERALLSPFYFYSFLICINFGCSPQTRVCSCYRLLAVWIPSTEFFRVKEPKTNIILLCSSKL
ncbi:hypothetical protein OS493_008991 [Desmophyllum pertusum]|uniref:Uncharacterized protein n=1 Tax=Desmophyllum pertusum TaxID=174260 RepID=A0A9W9ZFF4_9CNID|nr:hypothetical protein OS493_008991 [Desmophyllum pertusum]